MGCGTLIVALICAVILSKMDAPWWAYIILITVVVFSEGRGKKKPIEVPQPEATDFELVKLRIRNEIMEEEADRLRAIDIRERRLALREAVVGQRERIAHARNKDEAGTLKPGSLRLIRNTLMKLHEARRTDVAYQESETSKQATAILQGLNNMIDKKKGAA